ncbi:MAG: hypothetical protein AABY91_01105, partial [Gemmatimonadota bacterium]
MTAKDLLGRMAGGLALGLVLLGSPGTTRADAQDLGKLKFMEGCWKGEPDDGTVVEENWTSTS